MVNASKSLPDLFLCHLLSKMAIAMVFSRFQSARKQTIQLQKIGTFIEKVSSFVSYI